MNHNFQPSLVDANRCARCSYDQISHTANATCETCTNTGNMEIFAGMLMCQECIDKEMAITLEHQTPEKQEARLQEYNKLVEIRNQDTSIELRTDIFNAKIASIIELRETIEHDPSIENKQFEFASRLKDRFEHLKTVIFELKKGLEESGNEQRAIQSELNQLASKLRQEEREKLKLSDLNYQPQKPKLVKPRAPKTPKFDKAELNKYATELGIPVFNLQSMVIRRGCTVAEAAEILKGMLS